MKKSKPKRKSLGSLTFLTYHMEQVKMATLDSIGFRRFLPRIMIFRALRYGSDIAGLVMFADTAIGNALCCRST